MIDATDVCALFHLVLIVPEGTGVPLSPLSNASQFVGSWIWTVDVKVPLVTPPPEQPLIEPLDLIVEATSAVEPCFGSAGLKVAVPEVVEHVVPTTAPIC